MEKVRGRGGVPPDLPSIPRRSGCGELRIPTPPRVGSLCVVRPDNESGPPECEQRPGNPPAIAAVRVFQDPRSLPPPIYPAEGLKKKRTISALASGPFGSV
ncbi:hypothetical protein GCM10011534_28470 [Pseudooceanicola nanhaiensis]|uniref:Uncharacterized protein n=1 Tax=Pseudooceanicola nanhaiensis TaxID=375761 RepID=A0A917T1J8_9RHOB|nr:hypothetical protein GCM10011534_28470 [Pseudooceanicola nanhaiensis]